MVTESCGWDPAFRFEHRAAIRQRAALPAGWGHRPNQSCTTHPFREKRLLALFSHLQHRQLHSCFLVSTPHRSSRCSLNGYTVSSGHFPLW